MHGHIGCKYNSQQSTYLFTCRVVEDRLIKTTEASAEMYSVRFVSVVTWN